MTLYETLVVIVSAITLLVTMVGWHRTSRDQKQLLERQIAAEDNRTKLPILLTRRIDQLDKIRAWATETEQLRRSLIPPPSTEEEKNLFVANFRRWENAYVTEIRHLADILDSELARLIQRYYGGENYFMTIAFTGQPSTVESRLWNIETDDVRKLFRARLTELDKTILEH